MRINLFSPPFVLTQKARKKSRLRIFQSSPPGSRCVFKWSFFYAADEQGKTGTKNMTTCFGRFHKILRPCFRTQKLFPEIRPASPVCLTVRQYNILASLTVLCSQKKY